MLGILKRFANSGMLHYKDLFSTDHTSDSCCDFDSNIEMPLGLQEPKLPDLESNMHVEHAATNSRD